MTLTATALFILAILHVFGSGYLRHFANHYRKNSVAYYFWHVVSEAEFIFPIWAVVYLVYLLTKTGMNETIAFLLSHSFKEPLLIFVVMTVCCSSFVLKKCGLFLFQATKIFKTHPSLTYYFLLLSVGPLLGSFLTEAAAMTICASLLLQFLNTKNATSKFKYATLGTLFVNISVGGTLTTYAAPPILMIARPWSWDTLHLLTHFGWKGALTCLLTSTLVTYQYRHFLKSVSAGTISNYQTQYFAPAKVALFLAGLIVLGAPQSWWVSPVLKSLSSDLLYGGATLLTAIIDNAALTYLGSLASDMSDASKYALVSGSVVGGGLTLIANAPNLAGYALLNESFNEDGIQSLTLLKAALVPSLIAFLLFFPYSF